MSPDERDKLLADAVHDLDGAPEDLDAAALADQLQVHARLGALLRDRDLSGAVVRELRYEQDAPRFAAGVVGQLKAGRRAFPRLASLAAAACFLALTGWLILRPPSDQPAGSRPSALLVVGRLPLGEGDLAVSARLERLGFAVTAAAPGNLDPRGRALVAVSSTVLAEDLLEVSSEIRSRFRDLAVPILVWEPRLFHDLGLTAGSVHAVDWAADPHTALRIEGAHPLAAGLGGLVDVVRSREQLSWGRVGDAAIRVATLPGAPTKTALFGYERGSLMDGGVQAPARRVALFLFDTTAARLSDPGAALLDAAVLWCADRR
jgi:hypothetical protein